MSSITITCDWSGHDDGEMYTVETCNSVYNPSNKDWRITRKGMRYCPEHAGFICAVCEEPNIHTLGCPDIKTECIDCCGDTSH